MLRALRDERRRPRCVVLSNYATADVRNWCLELGADQVFDKSNQIDDLIGYCALLADGGGGAVAGALGV